MPASSNYFCRENYVNSRQPVSPDQGKETKVRNGGKRASLLIHGVLTGWDLFRAIHLWPTLYYTSSLVGDTGWRNLTNLTNLTNARLIRMRAHLFVFFVFFGLIRRVMPSDVKKKYPAWTQCPTRRGYFCLVFVLIYNTLIWYGVGVYVW